MSARHVVIHSASERVRLPQLGQFVGAALISIAPTWRGREVAFKTKCHSDRVIPIHPAAMDVLRERQARRVSEHPDEPVFLGPRGRHLGRSQINRAFRVARKEAGLPGSLNVHGCRHTFAVWLLTAGESLYRVSRLLGHDSIKITADTYGGLLSEQSAIGMDVFRS